MGAEGLDQGELAGWVRLASVLGLLPGVLDAQLRRDAGLMHFEYFVLAMLSEAPKRTLRMSALAAQTNSTPARLSHVVTRLEDRGFVERFPCPETPVPPMRASPISGGARFARQRQGTRPTSGRT